MNWPIVKLGKGSNNQSMARFLSFRLFYLSVCGLWLLSACNVLPYPEKGAKGGSDLAPQEEKQYCKDLPMVQLADGGAWYQRNSAEQIVFKSNCKVTLDACEIQGDFHATSVGGQFDIVIETSSEFPGCPAKGVYGCKVQFLESDAMAIDCGDDGFFGLYLPR